jgi:hypothetical protein
MEWGGKSGKGESAMTSFPEFSKWGTRFQRGPSTRALNKFIYGDVFPDYSQDAGPERINWKNDAELDLDVFRCPSDYGYAGHHYSSWYNSQLTSFDHYGNSYTAVGSWIGYPGPDCRLESNGAFLRPVSCVPNPRNTLQVIENCGKFAYRKNYGADGCASLSGTLGTDVETKVRGWHGRMWEFQATFVDGHASRIRMEGHTQPQPRLPVYPDCHSEDLENCYQHWHCVITRGPGWQIDTLPAPTVPTDLSCYGSGGVVDPIR